MADDSDMALRGCPRCGLVQHVPPIEVGQLARCHRCNDVITHGGGRKAHRQLCAAIALAALIIYPFGITLPVLQFEKFGHISETGIWAGGVDLLTHRHVTLGLIVLVCSVVVPVLKLLGLFLLTSGWPDLRAQHQATVYRWLELAGRWGMIDVLLVAMTVTAVKLGDMVQVTAGPGAVAFAACVLLSLVASMVFDPHAIWEQRTA
jgi:paraquat-inducible protein A